MRAQSFLNYRATVSGLTSINSNSKSHLCTSPVKPVAVPLPQPDGQVVTPALAGIVSARVEQLQLQHTTAAGNLSWVDLCDDKLRAAVAGRLC